MRESERRKLRGSKENRISTVVELRHGHWTLHSEDSLHSLVCALASPENEGGKSRAVEDKTEKQTHNTQAQTVKQ